MDDVFISNQIKFDVILNTRNLNFKKYGDRDVLSTVWCTYVYVSIYTFGLRVVII